MLALHLTPARPRVDRACLQWYIFIVEQIKTALIIIDGAKAIKEAAEVLSAALKGYKTSIVTAESFAGTDLLPVRIFFLGCEAPDPSSFNYLDQMLQHVNLAGRPCGVFSTDSKALKYLSKIIKASGAKAGEPLLLKDSSAASAAIKTWIKTIPASSF